MPNPFIWLILQVINIYWYIVLAYVIMSWLVSYNIINGRSPAVRQIDIFLQRAVDPLLNPIRRVLPNLGPLDISPIILLLGLQFLEYLVAYYGMRFF